MDAFLPPRSHGDGVVAAADHGLNPAAVADAIAYARTRETPPATTAYDHSTEDPWEGDPPEHAGALGPFPDRRGGQNGLILREGHLVAEWGDTTRIDHCFSVAKSFLSLLAGVAVDRGLFAVTDPVCETVDDGGFEGHNAAVTWEHLLHGTSEWAGTLFGKPDTADRNRPVGREAATVGERGDRELREPGTYWEYNDVRINRLSLSLLRAFENPLPRVLTHEVFDPINASRRWQWHGYHNSRVSVAGESIRSVSGGGHWGGGLWASTRDLARVGQLLLDEGRWDGEQVLPASWIKRATTPGPLKPGYGYLFWLNTGGSRFPGTPESSFAALGYGTNQVWVDPQHDLVVVLRWLDPEVPDGEVYRRLIDAIA